MEGPQFSTLAESQLYRSWGASVIGMTNMPEAKLAREAEICYCTVAMVTDYDSWHEGHGEVDVAKVIAVMKANSGNAKRLVTRVARDFPRQHPAVPHRFRPGAGPRHHDGTRKARSGVAGKARGSGGAGAAKRAEAMSYWTALAARGTCCHG